MAILAAALVTAVGAGIWWTWRPMVVDRSLMTMDGDLFSLRTSDGTTWILSTTPAETSVPPGTVVVIAGEESR